MKIKKFGIHIAELTPRFGTEPGKIRPIVVVQSDLLNNTHPSSIVCPITIHVLKSANILRVHLPKAISQLRSDSDILVDQIRALDNRRIKKFIGSLSLEQQNYLLENLRILILE